MTREIKFRAWDTDNKCMRYNITICKHIEGHLILKYWKTVFNYETAEEETILIPFDGEILQFTGLFDKNGIEIYEGDIVNDGCLYMIKYINNLTWDSGGSMHPGFYLVGKNNESDEYGFEMDYHIDFRNCEVIGNIYENKELLK